MKHKDHIFQVSCMSISDQSSIKDLKSHQMRLDMISVEEYGNRMMDAAYCRDIHCFPLINASALAIWSLHNMFGNIQKRNLSFGII